MSLSDDFAGFSLWDYTLDDQHLSERASAVIPKFISSHAILDSMFLQVLDRACESSKLWIRGPFMTQFLDSYIIEPSFSWLVEASEELSARGSKFNLRYRVSKLMHPLVSCKDSFSGCAGKTVVWSRGWHGGKQQVEKRIREDDLRCYQ
ncbi:MAG: hypothetical protein Q9173_002027 [Seirophora scorigena]